MIEGKLIVVIAFNEPAEVLTQAFITENVILNTTNF